MGLDQRVIGHNNIHSGDLVGQDNLCSVLVSEYHDTDNGHDILRDILQQEQLRTVHPPILLDNSSGFDFVGDSVFRDCVVRFNFRAASEGDQEI